MGASVLRGVPLWAWWIVVVVGVSLPVVGFTWQPQWWRVHVVPFSDPEDKPRDTLLNIGLFIPFGYFFARDRRMPPGALGGAMAAAALVSLGAEATQLFSTARNPSGTDVSMAVAGAAIGSRARSWWKRHSEGRS